MKICVLVKEVPDAAVEKRIDPSTGRMDRSGEKNLNPYDTHAIEAAMQIKEGGAVPVEEIVAVTMGPDSAVRALHKAVSLGADRSVHLSDPAVAGSDVAATGYALAKTLQRESPDLVLLGQQSDDGECYTIGAVVAEHLSMPSLTQVIKMDVDAEALRCERQAEYGYDTVQIKLPAVISVGDAINEPGILAEGDHGREEEAAGHRHGGRCRDRRFESRRRELGRTVGLGEGAAGEVRGGDHRGRGHRRNRRENRRLARREEADLDGKHPGLRAALRRRDQQELARRCLRGREARGGTRRRGARDPARRERPTGVGRFARQLRREEGARAEGPEGLAQPLVDAMAAAIQGGDYSYALFGGGLLGFEIGAGLAARLGPAWRWRSRPCAPRAASSSRSARSWATRRSQRSNTAPTSASSSAA